MTPLRISPLTGWAQYRVVVRFQNPDNRKEYERLRYLQRKNDGTQYSFNRLIHSKCKSLRQRCGGIVRVRDVRKIFDSQNLLCKICLSPLEKQWHLDHIVPLNAGGKSNPSNLQILCAPCNLGKGTLLESQYIDHCRKVIEAQTKQSS
jgi:5-methylcytosine-specific restriction endonuclease McrA